MNRHMSIIAENNVSVAWIEYLPDYVELQVWKKKKRSFPDQEFAHTNPIARLGSNTQLVANFTFTYSI